MDYEKILKEIVQIINTTEKSDIGFANICTYIGDNCPELAESEDELTWLTRFIKEEAYSLSMDIRDNEDRVKLKKLQRSLAWLEKQGEKPKKVSIWKHWKDGIAGGAEDEQIFLVKIGNIYSISSCLGCECDYIELSELDKLMQEENQSPNQKWDDELLMVITWFSRIKQLATDMTTWNNHVVKSTKECLYEITLVAKEALEYLNKQGE